MTKKALHRLSVDDVKVIFNCLFENKSPPERLRFKIVVVGSNGMKLSPPSFKFEDGLYVLLKPLKKVNGRDITCNEPDKDPRIPSNLTSFVFHDQPEENCPWSLSGPQYPKPTALQQRYCYPRGDPDYSSQKGGSLWTCYKEDGAEDFEFRILHVYFSAKRAGNKLPTKKAAASPPKKKQRKVKMESPPAVAPTLSISSDQSMQAMPPLQTPHIHSFESFGSAYNDSPLSFDVATSPIKDKSFAQILHNSSSIDTESEPLSTPSRNFFDIQTEFEKANGIIRYNTPEQKKKEDCNPPPSPKKTVPFRQPPPAYYPRHNPSYYDISSPDSGENYPRHWPHRYYRAARPHFPHYHSHPSQYPVQQKRVESPASDHTCDVDIKIELQNIREKLDQRIKSANDSERESMKGQVLEWAAKLKEDDKFGMSDKNHTVDKV